jgi:CBS domain-containing protein
MSGTQRATPNAQEIRFWMSTPPVTVAPDDRLSDALALMHEQSIRRLPVVQPTGELCGIITSGDIRGAHALLVGGIDAATIAQSLGDTKVHEVMTETPITVQIETRLREAAMLMLDNKIGGLPVLDDNGRLVGIITESDLFEALVCYLDRAAPDW